MKKVKVFLIVAVPLESFPTGKLRLYSRGVYVLCVTTVPKVRKPTGIHNRYIKENKWITHDTPGAKSYGLSMHSLPDHKCKRCSTNPWGKMWNTGIRISRVHAAYVCCEICIETVLHFVPNFELSCECFSSPFWVLYYNYFSWLYIKKIFTSLPHKLYTRCCAIHHFLRRMMFFKVDTTIKVANKEIVKHKSNEIYWTSIKPFISLSMVY